MHTLSLVLFSLVLSQPALGAKKKKYWYKVESETKEKKTKNNASYPYDSLEPKSVKRTFREIGFWPNQTNLSLGGGFLADKEFFKDDQSNRWFISSHLAFRNRSWHRMMAGVSLIQNNRFIVETSWHYLPSRKSFRTYYGFGLAHALYSEDQFRSLLKTNNYFITANYGFEILNANHQGVRGEAKAFIGSETYALQLLVSYIFHL